MDEPEKAKSGSKSVSIDDTEQPVKIKMLIDREYEVLNWEDKFNFPGLIRIRTHLDGSCLFHAIAKAYFEPYITRKLNGETLSRRDFVLKLRKELAETLGQKVNPSDPNSVTHYDTLSRGKLHEISDRLPEYSLKNLQKLLDSSRPVTNIFNEFISNQLRKDIYILDLVKHDVYMVGDDREILYKNRPSIVIGYLPGHYELIGIKNKDEIQTLFQPEHPLIAKIRDRMSELIK